MAQLTCKPFKSSTSKATTLGRSYEPMVGRSYRGRLDGTAKVIIIGQDPAADENVARRILVGSAGQRAQGFLRKLGLNKSYVMVNTFLYGLKGHVDAETQTISASAAIKNWRNQLLDMLKTPQIQAVIAFGAGAHCREQNEREGERSGDPAHTPRKMTGSGCRLRGLWLRDVEWNVATPVLSQRIPNQRQSHYLRAGRWGPISRPRLPRRS